MPAVWPAVSLATFMEYMDEQLGGAVERLLESRAYSQQRRLLKISPEKWNDGGMLLGTLIGVGVMHFLNRDEELAGLSDAEADAKFLAGVAEVAPQLPQEMRGIGEIATELLGVTSKEKT